MATSERMDTESRLARELRDMPNLVNLTEKGYVHTETYGKNNEIWYMEHDDGSFKFYNSNTDKTISDEPFTFNYAYKPENVDSKPLSAPETTNQWQDNAVKRLSEMRNWEEKVYMFTKKALKRPTEEVTE